MLLLTFRSPALAGSVQLKEGFPSRGLCRSSSLGQACWQATLALLCSSLTTFLLWASLKAALQRCWQPEQSQAGQCKACAAPSQGSMHRSWQLIQLQPPGPTARGLQLGFVSTFFNQKAVTPIPAVPPLYSLSAPKGSSRSLLQLLMEGSGGEDPEPTHTCFKSL